MQYVPSFGAFLGAVTFTASNVAANVTAMQEPVKHDFLRVVGLLPAGRCLGVRFARGW